MAPSSVHSPAALECHLLGQVRLELNGAALRVSFKKTLALLVYLTLEGATPRTKLAGLLWSELT